VQAEILKAHVLDLFYTELRTLRAALASVDFQHWARAVGKDGWTLHLSNLNPRHALVTRGADLLLGSTQGRALCRRLAAPKAGEDVAGALAALAQVYSQGVMQAWAEYFSGMDRLQVGVTVDPAPLTVQPAAVLARESDSESESDPAFKFKLGMEESQQAAAYKYYSAFPLAGFSRGYPTTNGSPVLCPLPLALAVVDPDSELPGPGPVGKPVSAEPEAPPAGPGLNLKLEGAALRLAITHGDSDDFAAASLSTWWLACAQACCSVARPEAS
jgi:hypothetical protein